MTWLTVIYLLTLNILFYTIFKRKNCLSLLSFKREVIFHIQALLYLKFLFKKFSFSFERARSV